MLGAAYEVRLAELLVSLRWETRPRLVRPPRNRHVEARQGRIGAGKGGARTVGNPHCHGSQG